MKYLLGISALVLILTQAAMASNVVTTRDNVFAVGDDGRIYHRQNCYDSDTNAACNFHVRASDQLPDSVKAQDLSIQVLSTAQNGQETFTLTAVGEDGVIYSTVISEERDTALPFARNSRQLPAGIKVRGASTVVTVRTQPQPAASEPVAPLAPRGSRW